MPGGMCGQGVGGVVPGVTNVAVSSPRLGGKRQEPAEASLTWILWWGCGQPAPRCQALPAPPCAPARGTSSGGCAPTFSLSLLFLLRGRGLCPGRRCEGVRGVLGIPDPAGPSPTGVPWCHQDPSGNVAAAQELLVCELAVLQGLGVTSSPQNCPL